MDIIIDERPARGGWAPGDYVCRCVSCDKMFQGCKHSWMCANCAYTTPDEPKPTLSIGDKIDIIERHIYKVVEDTTGILDCPTFKVHDRNSGRYRIVRYDSANGEWIALGNDDAAEYHARKKAIDEENARMNPPVEEKAKPVSQYKRIAGIHPVDEILPLIGGIEPWHVGKIGPDGKTMPRPKKKYIEMDGVNVKVTSDRYVVFKKSLACARCGLVGTHFAVERCIADLTDSYHFNLYGIDAEGNEILFTKDHIVPRAKGGKNHIDNYQTMCSICNHEKGDS